MYIKCTRFLSQKHTHWHIRARTPSMRLYMDKSVVRMEESNGRQKLRKWTIKLILHTMNLFCYHKTCTRCARSFTCWVTRLQAYLFVHTLSRTNHWICNRFANDGSVVRHTILLMIPQIFRMRFICRVVYFSHRLSLDPHPSALRRVCVLYMGPWMWMWLREFRKLSIQYVNKLKIKQNSQYSNQRAIDSNFAGCLMLL